MKTWLLLLLTATVRASEDLPDFVAISIERLDGDIFKVYTRIGSCPVYYHEGEKRILYSEKLGTITLDLKAKDLIDGDTWYG